MHLQTSTFHHLKDCSRGVRRSLQTSAVRAEQTGAGSTGEDLQQLDDTVTLFFVMQEHVSAAACLTDVFLIDFGQRQSHGGPQREEYH